MVAGAGRKERGRQDEKGDTGSQPVHHPSFQICPAGSW